MCIIQYIMFSREGQNRVLSSSSSTFVELLRRRVHNSRSISTYKPISTSNSVKRTASCSNLNIQDCNK